MFIIGAAFTRVGFRRDGERGRRKKNEEKEQRDVMKGVMQYAPPSSQNPKIPTSQTPSTPTYQAKKPPNSPAP